MFLVFLVRAVFGLRRYFWGDTIYFLGDLD